MTMGDRAMGMTAAQSGSAATRATAQFDMHFFEPVKIGETVDIACTVDFLLECLDLLLDHGDGFRSDRSDENTAGRRRLIFKGQQRAGQLAGSPA
ncbi:hypothetical protein QBK99_24715 [Corticibacterium sp. UT-5YL-CI-8]|nr:hypothetical protein [Tianweitania sp. UT-5YL-CI-8]